MLMVRIPPPRKRGEECQFRRTMVRAEDILMRLTRADAHVPWPHPACDIPLRSSAGQPPSRGPTHSRSTLPLQEPRSSGRRLVHRRPLGGAERVEQAHLDAHARGLSTRRQAPRTRPPMTSTLLRTLPKAKRSGSNRPSG